ncbi:MAG: phosphodiester glycosidase family protein [Acidimicrobiia bacterium]
MTASTSTPEPTRPRRRLLRALKISGIVLGALLVVLLGVAYWALDRYVFDHVQISDVAAFEANVAATTTAPAPAVTATAVTATAVTATTVPAATTSGAPAITESTYKSASTSISITKTVVGSGPNQVVYFVADVVMKDATALRGGFAQNKFGRKIIEDPSDIAADNHAVFAVNGDYYGYRTSGIVIRNGILYRDSGARSGLAIYRDGTMKIYDERSTSGEALLTQGVWNTVSFGPALVDNGEIPAGIDKVEVDTNIGNHSIQGNQPRTGIGMIAPGHFLFVVVDGRSNGYSRGLNMIEFAQVFKDHGAKVAYNLDGGGSTTMVFNGALVNNPLGKNNERGTSDILYIA